MIVFDLSMKEHEQALIKLNKTYDAYSNHLLLQKECIKGRIKYRCDNLQNINYNSIINNECLNWNNNIKWENKMNIMMLDCIYSIYLSDLNEQKERIKSILNKYYKYKMEKIESISIANATTHMNDQNMMYFNVENKLLPQKTVTPNTQINNTFDSIT